MLQFWIYLSSFFHKIIKTRRSLITLNNDLQCGKLYLIFICHKTLFKNHMRVHFVLATLKSWWRSRNNEYFSRWFMSSNLSQQRVVSKHYFPCHSWHQRWPKKKFQRQIHIGLLMLIQCQRMRYEINRNMEFT